MTEQQDYPLYPRLMVLLSALLFSTAAPVTKFVDFGPLNVSFFRSLTGIFALIAITPRGVKRELIKFTPRDLIGGIAYTATSMCFFLGIHFTSAANATILFQTSPVFLIPLGYFILGEKAQRRDIIAIFLMLLGVSLCFREGISIKGSRGDIFALIGALSFSFLNIIMRRNSLVQSIRLLIVGNIFIVLICLPFLLGGGGFAHGDIALSSLLGFLHMALPFVIYARALQGLRVVEASIYRIVESVLASLWVALLVGEIPGLWTAAGFLSVTLALIFRAGIHIKKKTISKEK